MRKVVNINRKWAFTKEMEEMPKEMPVKWNFVNLPHTWNNIDGQDGNGDYYRGTCYYAKEIEKNDLPDADQYYLEIRGANSSATVYINGKKAAHHDGGYSTWRVNITKYLSNRNMIVIEVDNSENDRVYPQNADFTFYGGLYRDVNIIAVNESHFDLDYYGTPGIKVTPTVNDKNCNVEVEVYLTNEKENQELVYKIKDMDGNTVFEKTCNASEKSIKCEISNVHLWDGRIDPYLYSAEVSLKENNEIIDQVSTKFGCRTFKIDPEKGFILNGRSYPLRGVSRHQDRWEYGNALLPEHHREDIELICEVGANAIRLAHYQNDQYFYDLCDEKGLIVWAEIPYISSHMVNGKENTISQMKELVTQNYNHPSIVVWGLSNEITIDSPDEKDLLENHKMLNDLVHKMDKTRLTTIAVVTMCDIHHPYIQIPDVVAYNHYFGWYSGEVSSYGEWFDNFHKEFPNIPIGISEYGCEALNWHTSDPKQGDYSEEYQAYYHEQLIKQISTRPYLWATFVWNMFDFGADNRNEGGENGQNHKGLVTFDRKYKKDSFYAYKAWLSKDPFVHICGKRYINRTEDETNVTVYSNLPEVELFVNGKSVGKQKCKDHFFHFKVKNQGKSKLVAKAGDYTDESHIVKVEEMDKSYIFTEKGAVLNWFDITSPEGYYSLNDKIVDIMKSEEAKKVFDLIIEKIEEQGNNDIRSLIDIIDNFTIIRFVNMSKAEFTKEELLEKNKQLNAIKKPD